MANQNYVKGLHRVRVTYPLGFSAYPAGNYPSNSLTGYGVALFGTGLGAATILRDDLGDTAQYGMAFYLKTGCTSTIGEFVGFHIDLSSDGTGAVVGIYSRVHSGTTGAKGSVRGIDGTVVIDTGSICTGSWSGISACLEIPATAAFGAVAAGACLELVSYNLSASGQHNDSTAFIWLREYSSPAGSVIMHLMNLYDTSATVGERSTIFSLAGLACKVGATTDFFIPVSLDLPSTTAWFGRGASTTSRESLGTVMTDGITLFGSTALASGEFASLRIDLSSTGAGSLVGISSRVTDGTTQKSSVRGIDGTAVLTGTTVHVCNGTAYGISACFEVANTVSYSLPDHACLELVYYNEGAAALSNTAHRAYIMLRDYSTTKKMDALFCLFDHTVGTSNDDVLFTSAHADHTASHGLKILVDSVPYWILCTNQLQSA